MVADKPAKLVSRDDEVHVEAPGRRYVGRGGEKLSAALDEFRIRPEGLICLDVGCSTGGFTDCLLQRGAQRVYAVDVGYGQFDWRLRQDPRVVLLERTNVRYLPPERIPDPIDLVVVDVSFISLTLVFPAIVPLLAPRGGVVALIKPQFEVGKGQVGRGGIVRDDALRHGAVEKISACAAQLNLEAMGHFDSPIEGRKGNREILSLYRLC
jgi:23S rRNA (cytidine1920-2'-O)/16S rRNA (cytidine1409-2'-O)-methyltransferase